MRNPLHDLFARRHRDKAIRHLRWLERKLPTPELRFAVPPAFHGRGHFRTMKIMQNGDEILELYRLVLARRPAAVVEIGTARGGTLYLWTQAAADDAVIVSVDLPRGPFGGGYHRARIPFYRAFARASQALHLVRADARDPSVREDAARRLPGGMADFLFIDADHRYESVRRIVTLWAPLVRAGGLIALHDVLPNPRDRSIGVWKLWERLSVLPGARTIAAPEGSQRPLGIGVLEVGGDRVLETVAAGGR